MRERKRHTARRVASARYATLPNAWGVPQGVTVGTPPTIQTWNGVSPPPPQTWDGVPPASVDRLKILPSPIK